MPFAQALSQFLLAFREDLRRSMGHRHAPTYYGTSAGCEDHLVVALQTFEADQKRVKSITAWPWIINTVSNAK